MEKNKTKLSEEFLRKFKHRTEYLISETPKYRPLVTSNEEFDEVPILTNEAGEQEDADQDHHHQKGGAAARVEAALHAGIFDGELEALFVGVDRLVFCAVVHVDALDVLHQADAADVGHQDRDLEQAVHQVKRDGVGLQAQQPG